jgi:hypothetical protein
VVDTFSGDKVKPFLDALNESRPGLEVKTFALHASPEALEQRLISRPPDQFRDIAVSKKLNSDVLKIHRAADTLLDTSHASAQQLSETVIIGLNKPSAMIRVNKPD